jgi:hypothetical protein
MDRIGLDRPTTVLRPENGHDGESRGGAIVGERYLAIHSVTSRKKAPGWSGEQGELTKVRDEDGVGPETVWCSGWRTAPTVVWAGPPRDDVGPLLRGKMEQRGATPVFITRGCSKQGKKEIWRRIRSVERWKQIGSAWRRRRRPWQVDPWCQRHAVRERKPRQRASWASWARPKAGKRETATRGDGPRAREQAATAMVGCGRGMGCWASQAES